MTEHVNEQTQAMDAVSLSIAQEQLANESRRANVDAQTELVRANARQVDATIVQFEANAQFGHAKAAYYRSLGLAVLLVGLGVFALLLALAVTR